MAVEEAAAVAVAADHVAVDAAVAAEAAVPALVTAADVIGEWITLFPPPIGLWL